MLLMACAGIWRDIYTGNGKYEYTQMHHVRYMRVFQTLELL